MATRSAACAVVSCSARRFAQGACRTPSLLPRFFSDSAGKGRVLSEEERAAENVYIQRMEREMMEKKKLKAERARAEKEKGTGEKAPEGNKA